MILVPIWLHNELRARLRVTNRNMSYREQNKLQGFVASTKALPFECVILIFCFSLLQSTDLSFYKITLIVQLVFLGPL